MPDETPAAEERTRRRGRSASEVRGLKARLRVCLMLGRGELECMDELGVSASDLRWLREQVMQDELAEVVNDSSAEVWAKYRLRMEGTLGDLDKIIKKAVASDSGPTLSAGVAAIKAKAQIIDKVLERGQDLGVLHREPDKSITVNGVAVTDMRAGELEKLVAERKRSLDELLSRYAITSYSDADEGDIYEDPSDPEPAPAAPRRKKVE